MTTLLFANNATSTLANPITSVDTSILLASGTGALFPNPTGSQVFLATIYNTSNTADEIVLVTARSGNTLTVVRGQEGTTAQTWIAGDPIGMYPTAGTMNSLVQKSMLQVVTSVVSTTTTSTSTSWVNTAVTGTITPQYANSKILVMVSASEGNYGYTNQLNTQLVRNGSFTVLGSYRIYEGFFPQGVGDNIWGSHSIQVIDSPNSTSAVTYTMQMRLEAFNGGYCSYGSGDTNGSIMVLMEIPQ